jgi:hypothetical protein
MTYTVPERKLSSQWVGRLTPTLTFPAGRGSYGLFVQAPYMPRESFKFGILAMNDEKLTFLNKVYLFAALAADDQEYIAKFLTQKYFARNTILFFQEKSNVENLFIIDQGAVELLFKKKERKLHRKLLQENVVFGGIAILMSGGKPTVTAQVTKDSLIYILPRR